METIVIFGAGAIGRGFLPWVLEPDRYRLFFVDANRALVNQLKARGQYTTFMTKGESEPAAKTVLIEDAITFSNFKLNQLPEPVACFIAVGPRRVVEAVRPLKGFSGPIILMENDDKCVEIAKASLGQDNVYFSIPDVIASNTASPEHLKNDPLALHTENGVLYVDENARKIRGEINYCQPEELHRQWLAKACLHNTPHCIAAYLGALMRKKYIHEVLAIPEARKVVQGAIEEMLRALKLRWEIPHTFLEWYADKEMKRFSNDKLYDPISRVAREPFRKLQLDGRLIGAALICMRVGLMPTNIILGIVAALLFDDGSDPDRHIIFAKQFLPPAVIFNLLLGLRHGETLHSILTDNFSDILRRLQKIKASASV